MKSTVMVLGAGTFQKTLIQQLKRLDYEIHVVSNRPSDVAVKYADVFHVLDYTETDKVWSLFNQLNAIQVFSAASDVAIETEAFIRNKARIKGSSLEFISHFTDKWNYKSELLQSKMNGIPNIAICKSFQDLTSFLIKYGQDGIVIKPRKGSGSKSVVHIHNELELQHFEWENKPADYIVEEYIKGQEYGGDFFVENGDIVFYFPTLKKVNQFKVPIAHLQLRPNVETYKLYAFLQELSNKMKLEDGIYNVDIIIRNNQPFLIDLAPRIGGNCIPQLNYLANGINEWGMLSQWLVYGQIDKNFIKSSTPHGVFIIGANSNGTIANINTRFIDQNAIVECFFKHKVGDKVNEFKEGANHIGYVIYKADDNESLLLLQRQIENFPWVEIVPDQIGVGVS